MAGKEIATLQDSISTAKNALETSEGAFISKAENARFSSDLDTDRLFTETQTSGKLDFAQQSKMTAYDTSRSYLENLDNSLGKLKETSVFDRASQLKNLKGQLNEEFISGYGLDNAQSAAHLKSDVYDFSGMYGHKSVLSNQFNIISSNKYIAENAIAEAVKNAVTNVFKVDLDLLARGAITGSKVLTEKVTHGITRALEEGTDAAIRKVLGNADKHIVDDAISFVEEAFRIGKSVSITAEELSARLARYGLNISFDIARAFVELVAVRAGIVGAITKLGFRGVKG